MNKIQILKEIMKIVNLIIFSEKIKAKQQQFIFHKVKLEEIFTTILMKRIEN